MRPYLGIDLCCSSNFSSALKFKSDRWKMRAPTLCYFCISSFKMSALNSSVNPITLRKPLEISRGSFVGEFVPFPATHSSWPTTSLIRFSIFTFRTIRRRSIVVSRSLYSVQTESVVDVGLFNYCRQTRDYFHPFADRGKICWLVKDS